MTLGLLLAVSSSSCLFGANLLSNSEFPYIPPPYNPVDPWGRGAGALTWSNQDHASNASTGSALLSDNDGYILVASMVSECVKIQGGSSNNLSAYFKAGSHFPSGSKLQLKRFHYSDSICTGTAYIPDATGATGFLAAPASWTKISQAHTAPSAAKSLRVQIEARSGSDPSVFDLLVDGVCLGSCDAALPSDVFSSNFESGSLTGWTVVQ